MKIQIKDTSNKVIFQHEEENNNLVTTLEKAVKEGADLRRANLRRANLVGADLRRANLVGADLRRANLERTALPMFSKWSFAIKDDSLLIGCKEKTFKQWEEWFNGEEEFSTRRGTDDFKRIYAMFKAYKAYYDALETN